jgi:hypothetical protein
MRGFTAGHTWARDWGLVVSAPQDRNVYFSESFDFFQHDALTFLGECPYKLIIIESQSWCDALRFAISKFEGEHHPVASIEEINKLLKGDAP